ncbi:unnamed protein product [Cyprideis torosa]|uniref:Uncharacterized protein n=1 Tax=Cyprideis torosa TaxID=163714 RepID=A0A7R8ZQ02_9CRUS|nr:unnamed protein product [Cyprideis torosa]CAG0895183.1 unnamed protein product [Cyprideis torosa]
MSSQRGNTKKAGPPKHQNSKAFKNDLHDRSGKQKQINAVEIVNVCQRCAEILEWRIRYRKYKPLTQPKKCCKCEQRRIRRAYHLVCEPCSLAHELCSKCGKKEKIMVKKDTSIDHRKLDAEFAREVKELSERKRRTFMRYLDKLQAAEVIPAGASDIAKKKFDELQAECKDEWDADSVEDDLEDLTLSDDEEEDKDDDEEDAKEEEEFLKEQGKGDHSQRQSSEATAV